MGCMHSSDLLTNLHKRKRILDKNLGSMAIEGSTGEGGAGGKGSPWKERLD